MHIANALKYDTIAGAYQRYLQPEEIYERKTCLENLAKRKIYQRRYLKQFNTKKEGSMELIYILTFLSLMYLCQATSGRADPKLNQIVLN
mgnify:CR=1 FL=1